MPYPKGSIGSVVWGEEGKPFVELGRMNSNSTGKEGRSEEHFNCKEQVCSNQEAHVECTVLEAVRGPAELNAVVLSRTPLRENWEMSQGPGGESSVLVGWHILSCSVRVVKLIQISSRKSTWMQDLGYLPG